MGKEEEKEEGDIQKKKPLRLSLKDSIALFLAAVSSLLLPLIILAIMLIIVAVVLFVLYPGR